MAMRKASRCVSISPSRASPRAVARARSNANIPRRVSLRRVVSPPPDRRAATRSRRALTRIGFASPHAPRPQLLDESALDAKYGSRVSDESVSKSQRRDLIQGVKRGDDASERLDAAVSMASRTDEVGDAILQNLQEQREKIMSARVSAETMEEDMNISERRMTRMACEKCIQKWVLWVILAAVLAGLVVFAYYKLEIEPSRRTPGAAAAAAMGKRGARRLLMMVRRT